MDQHLEPFPQLREDDVQVIQDPRGPSSNNTTNEQEQLLTLKLDTVIDVLEDLDDDEDENISAEIRSVFAKHFRAANHAHFCFCAGRAGEDAFFCEIKAYFHRILKPRASSDAIPLRHITAKQLKAEIKSCLAIGLFSFLYEWAVRETTVILTRKVGRATPNYTPQKLKFVLDGSELAREVMEIWKDGLRSLIERIVLRGRSTSGVQTEAKGDI